MQQLGGGLDDAQWVANFVSQAHGDFTQGMQAVTPTQLGFQMMQLAQAFGHVVEGAAQLRQFVTATDHHTVRITARDHRIHTLGQIAQGLGQAPRHQQPGRQ